jgi:hypothetical protein
MTAAGLLAAMTWSSLLLDRRDALVLGSLPTSERQVVRAKITALAGYIGIVALGMHAISAVPFGAILATGQPFTFLVRGIVAHFAASTAACAFILLSVVSVQALAMAAGGPAAFRRISPALHVTLVAGILFGLTALPAVARAIGPAVSPDGGPWWTALAPPVWFVGTYEWLLGTDNDELARLHWRAMAALAAVSIISFVIYPMAYRRVSVAAIEGSVRGSTRPAGRLSEWIAATGVRPASRAAASFLLLSLARVDRLRFMVAAAAGLVIGWSAPTVIYWAGLEATAAPPAPILAVSLAAMAILLAGVRIAVAMPADLPAAWLIRSADVNGAAARSGVWRATFVVGVAPVVLAFLPAYAWSWGAGVAVKHLAMLLIAGALATELLLWNHEGMPCSRPWRPEQLNLGRRWPLFALAFAAFSGGLGYVEAATMAHRPAFAMLAAAIALAACGVRIASRRRPASASIDVDDLGAPAVLRLN